MSGASLDIDLSGFGLRFESLRPALHEALAREWAAYVRPPAASPMLVIRVEDDERVMTPGRFMDGALEIEAAAGAVRFRRDEGEVEQETHEARAVARLSRGDEGRRLWGLVNLTLAAVGWRLLARGGGALHAAGALLDEKAYLLVGPSGCGKTTWAKSAAQAGLRVLSDDCVLTDFDAGRLVALGSPFRARDFPGPGPGRWPVAGILLPHWAAEPSLAPVSRVMLEARIAANLLFSIHTTHVRAAAADAAIAISSGAPARVLAFRPDESWVDVVRSSAL